MPQEQVFFLKPEFLESKNCVRTKQRFLSQAGAEEAKKFEPIITHSARTQESPFDKKKILLAFDHEATKTKLPSPRAQMRSGQGWTRGSRELRSPTSIERGLLELCPAPEAGF